MPEPICYSSRQVARARIALLDQTGAPDAGSENGYVSKLVSVQMTPQLEEGEEFTLKTGDGDICASFRDNDKIKGNNLVLSLCQLDAQMIGLATGATIFEDNDGVMGLKIPKSTDDPPAPVCFEWWTIAQDGSSQATLNGSALYWHHVVPFNRFTIGDHTFENGILTVVLNGKGEENTNITINGPFDDWPAGVVAEGGADSAYAYWRETSLPVASCDYVSVSSAAS